MTSGGPQDGPPESRSHTESEGAGSKVVLGYLLGGRSPAERVEFLAAGPPAGAAAGGPRRRIYRNYTRRLREE